MVKWIVCGNFAAYILIISFCCSWPHVQNEAARRAKEYYEVHSEFQDQYQKWHKECHELRKVMALITRSLNYYTKHKYVSARISFIP